MKMRDIAVDVQSTFGVVKFKKISSKIFKYDAENKKTDEFLGYKILVESVLKRDVFEVKILDDSVDNYRSISTLESELYDSAIEFEDFEYNAYVFKSKLYESVAANSFRLVKIDG